MHETLLSRKPLTEIWYEMKNLCQIHLFILRYKSKLTDQFLYQIFFPRDLPQPYLED